MNKIECNYLHIEYGRVDKNTGELEFYITTPKIQDKPIEQERHYYKSRDREELHDIVKRYKEKRYSNVSYYLDKDVLGKWYIPILTLCSKVDYFNVGFYDREYLCKIFDVKDSNLNKTLNKFQSTGLLRYTGKGLTNNYQIRIIWNPINVWKGWEDSLTKSVAIQEWYKEYFKLRDRESVSVECSEEYIPVEYPDISIPYSPDPYVSPYYHFEKKDRFRYLMDITDAEFELYLLNVE